MKELKLYQCEVCGVQYNEKNKAVQCERNHTHMKSIKQCRYVKGSKFPETMVVEFTTGETLMYFRGKQL